MTKSQTNEDMHAWHEKR